MTRPGSSPIDMALERITGVSDEQQDAAVCNVLRWAEKNKLGPDVAHIVCAALGLSIVAAVKRSRDTT